MNGGMEAARRTSLADRSVWRRAQVVRREYAAEDMVALTLRPDQWIPHRAGQYCDLRFPGETLSRAYSIVSPPGARGSLEFGIQTLPTAFLSRRFAACSPGEVLELRGPIGAAFTWDPAECSALILLGAGAGITPLLSMYDYARAVRPDMPLLFLVSATTPRRVFRYQRYRDALITRFTGTEPRMDRRWLAQTLAPLLAAAGTTTDTGNTREAEAVYPLHVRVCGPTGFISERVEDLLALGIPPEHIRSEAFV